MSINRLYCHIIVLLSIPYSLKAGGYETLIHLTTVDGLPSNEIYFSFNTRNGATWICTDHGLVMYDGEIVQNYTERHGLPGRAVFFGTVDILGNIWLATNGGICMVVGDSIFTPEFNQDLLDHPNYSLINQFTIVNSGTIYATTVGPNNGFFKIRSNKVDFIEFPDNFSTGCEEQIFELIIHDTVRCRGLLRTNRSVACRDTMRMIYWDTLKLVGFSNKQLLSGNNQYTVSYSGDTYVWSVRKELFIYREGIQIRKISFSEDILNHIKDKEDIYLSIRDKGLIHYNVSTGTLDTILMSGSYSYFKYLDPNMIELCDLKDGYKIVGLSNEKDINTSKHISSSIVAKPYLLKRDSLIIYADGNLYLYDLQDNFSYLAHYEISNHSDYSTQFTKSIWQNDRLIFNHGYVELGDLNELFYHEEVHPSKRIKSRWVLSDSSSILASDHHIFHLLQDSLVQILDLRQIGQLMDLVELESMTLLIATTSGLFSFSLSSLILEQITNEGVSNLVKVHSNYAFCILKNNSIASYRNKHLYPIDSWFIHERDIVYEAKWKNESNSLWLFTNNSVVRWQDNGDKTGNNVTFFYPSGFANILTVDDTSYLAYNGIDLVEIDLIEANDINELRLMWLIENDFVSFDDYKAVNTGDIELNIGARLSIIIPFHLSRHYQEIKYRYKDGGRVWLYPEDGSIDLSSLAAGEYCIELMGLTSTYEWQKLRDYKFRINHYSSGLSWLFAIILTIVGSSVTLYFTREYNKSINLKMLDTAISQGILNTHSAQMTPHFFFNSLSSIRSYVKDESSEVLAFINTLSNQIRGVMDSLRYQYVSISSELGRVEDYIKIEQFRRPGLFKFIQEISKEAKLELLLIPPMIIQPIVENCIVHAFKNIESGGAIKLIVRPEDSSIHIYIMDNGCGFVLSEPEPGGHKSIGLDSIKARLAALSKLEKKRFDLDIESNRENGTSIKLIIPKIYSYEKDDSGNSRG